ncbi:unnamed protein product [Macrosiphum euphorbiae]|uniref:Uncharacterized protein n=1 Tax=Macrosiphum euphorbiae TaxID=13131 RepID=A0AAV0W0U8_9HEMI|nr:unnamed protein product [Macrosiphum euphorbiae]
MRSALRVMYGATAKAFCPPPPMPAHSPYKSHDPLATFRPTYLAGTQRILAAVSLATAEVGKPSPSSDSKDPMCGGPTSGCGQQQQHVVATATLEVRRPMSSDDGSGRRELVAYRRYSATTSGTCPHFRAPVLRARGPPV